MSSDLLTSLEAKLGVRAGVLCSIPWARCVGGLPWESLEESPPESGARSQHPQTLVTWVPFVFFQDTMNPLSLFQE